jgi:hypothetical protein
MTGPSIDDDERVYRYLVEHITAKKYPPSRAEINQAMGLSQAEGDRRRTRQHSRSGTFLPSDEIQIDAALEALQQGGKIRLGRPKRGTRLDIRLESLPIQQTTTVATEPANTVPASAPRLMPGPIICIECANPVCEESKCRCALHLRLAREAGMRLNRRRGVKPWRPGGPGRPPTRDR